MLPKFDLTDPDVHRTPSADEIFRHLRREDPVYWHESMNGEPGFWCITKHADIAHVSRNPKTFSSDRELGGYKLHDEDTVEDTSGVSMIQCDPPLHTKFRKMLTPGFAAARVRDMAPVIERRVADLLDEVPTSGRFDFVEAISVELPIQVLADLLGVKQESRGRLFQWSEDLIATDDPEIYAGAEDRKESLRELAQFAFFLWKENNKHPGENLVSLLVHHRDEDGRRLSMKDFLATFILMIVAGNETTRSALSWGMRALHDNPDQKHLLMDDPNLWPKAVKEIVRWGTPIHHMRRTATCDTELRGKTIRRGDKVVLWYLSGNRDEEAFDQPYRFDVRRSELNVQLGYGQGAHYCLGARLAEVQMIATFREVLRRFPDIRVVGKVDRLRSLFVNGIKRLPVSVDRPAAVG